MFLPNEIVCVAEQLLRFSDGSSYRARVYFFPDLNVGVSVTLLTPVVIKP
jgi:hypothetical protein